MAVAAEQMQTDYLLVDAIPGAYQARQLERDRARSVLEQRRDAWASGRTGEVPLAIDALSTADTVLQARYRYGTDSLEYAEANQALLLDTQRLVGEWYRKKKAEYFEPVRHQYDEQTQEYFSHGLSIRQMTENALTPITDNPEEEARRINERVEDATPQILRSLGCVSLGSAIRTISQCTDKAIADYASDVAAKARHRGYGGYVPEIEKLMIRDIRFDDGTNDRFEEQVGLRGTYLTHYVIQKALERKGVAAHDMGKTELHGAQIVASDDLLEFVALLDTVAGEEWCTNIFMGEEVAGDYRKDYGSFRREALERQESLKGLAGNVAAFILDLAADGYDRRKAPAKVEEFVKHLLLDLGKADSGVAEQMFDQETAAGLQAVRMLEERGEYARAYELMQEVVERAPGGGFCGAGSCGLEGVDKSSAEYEDIAKEFGAKSGDTVLKDTERSCPNCRNRTVIYVTNKSGFIKGCTSCKSSKKVVSKSA